MKFKLSISVDEKTIDIIQENIRKKRFASRSHAIEYSVRKALADAEE